MQHPHLGQSFLYDAKILGIVPFQSLLVGRAAHKYHIPDGKIKIIVVMLGNNRNFQRGFPEAVFRKGLPIQKNRPACGLQHPVDTLKQSALAAAVGADYPDQLFFPGLEAYPLQNGIAIQDGLQILCLYLHQSPPPNP